MTQVVYMYFYTLWVLNSDFHIAKKFLFVRSLLQLLASLLMLILCTLLFSSEILSLVLPPFMPIGKSGALIALPILIFFGYYLTNRFLIEACGVDPDTGRSHYYHYNPSRAAKIGVAISWVFIMLILPLALGLWANGITSLTQIHWTN